MNIKNFFTPHLIFFLSHVLAFLVWMIPEDYVIRKGFAYSGFSIFDVFLYLSYVFVFSFSIFCSFNFASKFRLKINYKIDLSRGIPLLLISLMSFVGSFFSFYKATGGISFQEIIDYLINGRANELKNNLYSNYSAGLYSLRYLAIPAATLTLFRIANRRKINFIDIINIFSILITSSLASRLSVIWASIAASGLIMNIVVMRLNFFKVLLIFFTLISVLFLFNYSRNKLYYEAIGADSILSSGLAEVSAYLGSPVQGAIIALNNIDRVYSVESEISSSIESSLTTNSAIAEILSNNGGVAGLFLWYIFLVFFSFVLGFVYKSRSFFFKFLYYISLYPFAEFWRINLFDKGIFVVVISSIAFIGLMSSLLMHLLGNGLRRTK